jgi:nitrite reductase/ring-hydroxylating ferredoxin subunit
MFICLFVELFIRLFVGLEAKLTKEASIQNAKGIVFSRKGRCFGLIELKGSLLALNNQCAAGSEPKCMLWKMDKGLFQKKRIVCF